MNRSKKHAAWILAHPIRRIAQVTLTKHRARGFDVKITTDELVKIMENTSICPICGEPLTYGCYKGDINKRNLPSVDRKDNHKTMTKENTWVICFACNVAKGEMTMDEFKQYISTVHRRLNL
jgi:5-methylcytosine-specific restriction endonuclease McrA